MKGILIFIVAVVWGSLSAQFLVQMVTSLAVGVVSIGGIAFSKENKGKNLSGILPSVLQAIFFGILSLRGKLDHQRTHH